MLEMLNQIKNFKTDRYEIDEVVAMLAFAKMVVREYEAIGEPKPIELSNCITDMQQDLTRRTRDRKMARINELQHFVNRNKPKEIKVAEANNELEKLRNELGLNDGANTATS